MWLKTAGLCFKCTEHLPPKGTCLQRHPCLLQFSLLLTAMWKTQKFRRNSLLDEPQNAKESKSLGPFLILHLGISFPSGHWKNGGSYTLRTHEIYLSFLFLCCASTPPQPNSGLHLVLLDRANFLIILPCHSQIPPTMHHVLVHAPNIFHPQSPWLKTHQWPPTAFPKIGSIEAPLKIDSVIKNILENF